MSEVEITQQEYRARLSTGEWEYVTRYWANPEDTYHARVILEREPNVTYCILREKGGAKG
jgi:hypothetical protein